MTESNLSDKGVKQGGGIIKEYEIFYGKDIKKHVGILKEKLNEANINQPIVEEIIDGVFGGDLI